MNKRLTATTLLILVLIPASLPLGPTPKIHLVHGLSSGIICITDPALVGCPAAPANITAVQGTTFTIAVNVFNSGSLNGFAISLHVDPHFLKPINATQDASIIPTLPGTTFTANPANCANNGANGPPSNVFCTSNDGNGTTTFSLVSVGGLSIGSTTGRLFEASYQVVGNVPSNGASIGYVVTGTPTATGTATCNGTSIPNVCVTVESGTGPTPESLAQIAIFHTVTSYFTTSTSPSSLTITQASSQTSTLALTGTTGFTGTASLSSMAASGLPTPTGLTISFTPSSTVTLPPSPNAATVNVQVGKAMQPGTYNLLIVATSGLIVRYSPLNITVQGFTMFLESGFPRPTLQGQNSIGNTMQVTGGGGFTGTVILSATITNTTTNPPTISLTSSVTVSQTSPIATATLNITTTKSTPARNYNITITAKGGSIVQTLSRIFTVLQPDFSIALATSTVVVAPGSSNNTIITVTSLNTLNGTVTLTKSGEPTGVSISFNTTSLTITSSKPIAYSKLTISSLGNTVAGNYPISITGTNMSLTHTVTFTLVVLKSGFSLAVNPAPLIVIAGKTNSSTITVSRVGIFNGTVTLTATPANKTLTSAVNPNSVFINQATQSATSTLTITAASATSPGPYYVKVTGTNLTYLTNASFNLTVIVVRSDFTVSSPQPIILLQEGGSNTTTISLVGLYRFNGTVTLATLIPNATLNGPFAAIKPTLVTLTSTSSTQRAILVMNATTSTLTGIYLVTITAGNTTLSHTITIEIVIPDFGIQTSPSSIRIVLGVNQSSALSNVTFTSIRQLFASVSLAASITPASSAPTIQLTSKLLLQPNKTNMTQLLVIATSNTPALNYTITMTATSGALIHAITINLEVIRPYVVMKTPILQSPSTTGNVTAGQIPTVYVQVANPSKVNASVTVTLDVYNSIGNSNLTVAHQDLNLQPGDNITVTLHWDTTSYTPGKYSLYVRIISTNMIIDKSTKVSSLTLNPAPQQASQLPGGNGLWIAVAIVAVLAVAGYLYIRRKRRISETPQPLGT